MVETIREPARDVPVYAKCDVLVVGGGPAGTAAASCAARLGADTILLERYGYLGGMSTGGFVLYIDKMTDWDGKRVIAGFAEELLDRLPREGIIAPPKELWGSKDPVHVDYWRERHNAHSNVVHYSPSIDPEWLKLVSFDVIQERKVRLVLHSWGTTAIKEGNEVKGIVFESKEGRKAILAKMVIDCTGDGDIFATAGAPFEGDIIANEIHSTINVSFRWGGCDFNKYLNFQSEHKEEFDAVMALGAKMGVHERPYVSPRPEVVYFMSPKLHGYSCINVQDLTTVEIESRQAMLKILDFYRKSVPGFEGAWIMDTSPQMGVRHSRRLVGVKTVTRDQWVAGKRHEDEIGICPAPSPGYPNVSVPLGSFIPKSLDGLVVAGRNLSCDAASPTFLRLIQVCWLMGQGVGTAAAIALNAGVSIRNVNIAEVQNELAKQGVPLHGIQAAPEPRP